jgi:hypothetical protein
MAPASTTRNALILVSLFGLAWAHAIGLTQFFAPSNIDWMIEGDWMGHLFGWLFVKNGPWSLPLAQAPDLVYPAGSSAALTDAIPLLSVIGKLLSPLFGDRVQFFGAWMVLGVIGTGVAGVLVCRAWLHDTISLALAGCLFVMNPIVTTRYGHPPFFAFWLLTGLVGACVWPVTSLLGARRTAAVTLLLGFLACATNAYLAVMASLLVGASIVRLVLVSRQFKAPEAVGWLVAGPVVSLSALWLFGFISGVRSTPMGSLAIEGFGQFSADLLTFANPATWSRFFGPIPTQFRQYEGFAYLGLGTLALLGVRVLGLAKVRPVRGELLTLVPVLLACALMAAYAPSNLVTFAGKPVLDLSAFYAKLGPWPAVFRSSGRFVWPLFALLTMLAVLWLSKLGRATRLVLLWSAVLLQFVDFDPTRAPLHKPWPTFTPLRDPAWQLMKDGYRHVVVHPVQIQWTCPFNGPFIAGLSWEAYRGHLSINSGHVGRPPPGTDCQRHLPPAELSRDTVYIPYFKDFLVDFQRPELVCGPVEDKVVCVFRDHDTPLLRELLRRASSG